MTKLFLGLLLMLFLVACSPGSTVTIEPIEAAASTLPATETQLPTYTSTVTITSTAAITPTSTITLIPTSITGPAPTLAPTNVTLITNGSRDLPYVALTFDVGERPSWLADFDHEIERVLNETETPATFFMGGHWMMRHPEITRRLSHNPLFEMGNHSWAHPDFTTLTQEQLSEEILLANDMYYQLTGKTMNLFRLPGGTYNDLALGMIAYHGMLTIQWDVVTGDPVPDNDAENIVRIVMERVQNGSIIVMHANGRGWHTAEALPEMIRQLREAGYQLVTVSEVLELEP